MSVGLQSLLVWLGNYGHLSYSKQQELLRELGGIEIGVGTLQATNERLAKAVKGSVDQLREWVKKQPQVHVDESLWPVLGLKEWLWVTTGQKFCLFHAGDTRSRAELISQLGETFEGRSVIQFFQSALVRESQLENSSPSLLPEPIP